MNPLVVGILLIIAGVLIAIFVPGAISALGGLLFAIGIIVIGITLYTRSNKGDNIFEQ